MQINNRISRTSMEFTSRYGVRFKIFDQRNDNYLVKYYTEISKWPRIYRTFTCPSDQTRHEMFFVLGNTRACVTCKDSLLGYKDEPARTQCRECLLRDVANRGVPDDAIEECPVCYQKILTIDNSKQTLVCKHSLCRNCFRRMSVRSSQIYYDPIVGLAAGWNIKCPMCRQTNSYDQAFMPIALLNGE